ncbi:UNVERIFIED_ORG: hypothetical protein QFZ59_004882 [Bacillus sp. B2I3]|nr:hypothetical protein [Bacillus sp. B2I3]
MEREYTNVMEEINCDVGAGFNVRYRIPNILFVQEM